MPKLATWHVGICGWCGSEASVTEPRDYGHPPFPILPTTPGWADTSMIERVYTHAEDADAKILEAFRTGRVQAEKETGLKLAKGIGNEA